ncbi:MAG: hypothetical protein JXA57_08925 [Armatimonadetes bacterium]|nr:hypothetical protein [Armatimonadota bacterium]
MVLAVSLVVLVLGVTVAWRVWSTVRYSRQLRAFREQLEEEQDKTSSMCQFLKDAMPNLAKPDFTPPVAPKISVGMDCTPARTRVGGGVWPVVKYAAPATVAGILERKIEEHPDRRQLLRMLLDVDRDRGWMQVLSRAESDRWAKTSYLIAGSSFSAFPSWSPTDLAAFLGTSDMLRQEYTGRTFSCFAPETSGEYDLEAADTAVIRPRVHIG